MGGNDPYSSSKGCAELVTAAWRRSFNNGARHDRHRLGSRRQRHWRRRLGKDRLIPDCIRPLSARTAHRHQESRIDRGHGSMSSILFVAICSWPSACHRIPAAYAEAWNFGPGEEDAKPVVLARGRVVELGAMTRDGNTVPGDGLHEAVYLKLDASKARARLGWTPATWVRHGARVDHRLVPKRLPRRACLDAYRDADSSLRRLEPGRAMNAEIVAVSAEPSSRAPSSTSAGRRLPIRSSTRTTSARGRPSILCMPMSATPAFWSSSRSSRRRRAFSATISISRPTRDMWLRHCRRLCRENDRRNIGSTALRSSSKSPAMTAICCNTSRRAASACSGVEPAANVAEVARGKGIETEVAFFGAETARGLPPTARRADLHGRQQRPGARARSQRLRRRLQDPAQARRDRDLRVPAPLAPDRGAPVRHHLSRAFLLFLAAGRADRSSPSTGCTIVDVEELATHGGSLRLYVSHADDHPLTPSARVENLHRR